MYLICHLSSSDHVFRGWCEYACKSFKLTHHIAKFNGHTGCESRDITHLNCYVTLQDHVIKGSCDFIEEGSLLYVRTLPILVIVFIIKVMKL